MNLGFMAIGLHTPQTRGRTAPTFQTNILLRRDWPQCILPLAVLILFNNVAESTVLEWFGNFVQGVVEIFGAEYLQRPTVDDVERLLQVGTTTE